MDSIDYYISSKWFEIEAAQQFYSECLLKTDCLSVIYPPIDKVDYIPISGVKKPYMVMGGTKDKITNI